MVKKFQRGRPTVPQRKLMSHLQRVRVNEGDVLVLNTPERIGLEQGEYINKMLNRLFPNNQVLLLDGGKTIGVLVMPSVMVVGVADGAH